MSIEFYRTLHIFGLFLLFTSIGAAAIHAMNGGTKESNQARKWVSITHGVALTLVLVAGFGLLAKSPQYGMAASAWPGYIYFKIGLWFVFGGVLVLFYRKPEWAKSLWVVLPLLGAVAAAFVFKLIEV